MYVASMYVLCTHLLNRVYGISEFRSDRSKYRKRERERETERQRSTGATRVVWRDIWSKDVLFDYKLRSCLEASTIIYYMIRSLRSNY